MRSLGNVNRILVVEDSALVRRYVSAAVSELAIEVVEAPDGADAMTKFNAGEFLAVITDWTMPNKDGLQLIQEIRLAGSRVPIIMITTEASPDNVLRAMDAGANCYLIKPFDANALKWKLQLLMRRVNEGDDNANTGVRC